MGADTWINLVQHSGTVPPKRSNVAPKPRYGWFWVDRSEVDRDKGSAGRAPGSSVSKSDVPQRPVAAHSKRASLSSASAISSEWEELTREDALSGDDLSDLEDPDLVCLDARDRAPQPDRASPAPAQHVVTSPPQVEPIVYGDEGGGRGQACHGGPSVRQRAHAVTLHEGGAKAGTSHPPHGGPGSASTQNGLCWDFNLDSNSDLVWTFVAGMMLYFVSV